MEPEVRYARNGSVAIAYEVIGDGPMTLVCLSPFGNLEVMWENPLFARYLRSLSDLARVVVMDRRGTGLSDRFSPDVVPPLEDLVDDITVVLDATGRDRAVLFGFEEAAAQCAMFAASRPDRVAGLILYAATACGVRKPDYPWQWSEDEWENWLANVQTRWGTAEFARESLRTFNPSHADDGQVVRWWGRYQRLSTSPGGQLALEQQMRATDIRALLPAIGVRALVLHRTDDSIEPVGQGRFIASLIPGAMYVELPGADHEPWAGDSDQVVDQIKRFLVDLDGHQAVAERVLVTVLFTDIVGSTEKVASLGDAAWKALIARQRDLARHEIERFRGRWVDSAGDGMFAVFDGPARAVRCAQEIARAAARLGLEVRAGCHTGEVEAVDNNVSGLAVHIGARIAALAGGSQVWVSSTVRDLTTGSGLAFDDLGEFTLKGVPGSWHLHQVSS